MNSYYFAVLTKHRQIVMLAFLELSTYKKLDESFAHKIFVGIISLGTAHFPTVPYPMERMAVEMCNLSDLIEEKGIQQGEQHGIEVMAQLSVKLADAGKITEISRAASDHAYLEQLLKDYGIAAKEL